MAYWAEAIGLDRPLEYRPSDADMKRGWELIQKAEALKPNTQRERDYLEAAEILYRPDERNYATRNHEYSERLEKTFTAYSDDTEAAVFYALSLITRADTEHPVEDSEKAIAILNPVFAQHPDHPGIAHYIIHAADTPGLAAQGLDAARQYAQIAPAAPHALHMPSHIFAQAETLAGGHSGESRIIARDTESDCRCWRRKSAVRDGISGIRIFADQGGYQGK